MEVGSGTERAAGRDVGVREVTALCSVGGARGHRMAVWGRFAAWGRERRESVCPGLCARGGPECRRAGRGDTGGTRPAPGREGSFVSAPGVGGGEPTCARGTGAWRAARRGRQGAGGR